MTENGKLAVVPARRPFSAALPIERADQGN